MQKIQEQVLCLVLKDLTFDYDTLLTKCDVDSIQISLLKAILHSHTRLVTLLLMNKPCIPLHHGRVQQTVIITPYLQWYSYERTEYGLQIHKCTHNPCATVLQKNAISAMMRSVITAMFSKKCIINRLQLQNSYDQPRNTFNPYFLQSTFSSVNAFLNQKIVL